MSGKVYLVDGSGYIFRAFYAVAPLTTKDGFPTNALFGYTRMLLKLIDDARTNHMLVAFDTGRDTFRKEMYSPYKANRVECPKELELQMPYFREITSALGFAIMELPGYEADDVIGTLVRKLSAGGVETVVISGDKDLLQLVGPGVSVWDPMHEKHYGPQEVKAKFGLGPEKVVEFLGLTGDSSDNVPGLKGVGPKTALQLLEKFGDVEGVIRAVEAIRNDASIRNRNKIADQIESDAATLRLSRKLVEINTSAPVSFEVAGSKVGVDALDGQTLCDLIERTAPRGELLQELLTRFEFGSLFKNLDLRPKAEHCAERSQVKFSIVYRADFPLWSEKLQKQKEYALDLETTSLDVLEARIVGASFCWSDSEAFYVPLGHQGGACPDEQVRLEDFLKTLGPSLSNPAVRKFGQNLKYDIGVLACNGVELAGLAFDSMLASYLLNPDKGSHNLTSLSRDYLNYQVIEYAEVTQGRRDFSEVPVVEAARYAGEDAWCAWKLAAELAPLLQKEGLKEVFEKIELPLVPVLSALERRGVRLDCELLARISAEFAARLEELRRRMFDMVGFEFNLNSPKQLSEVLFDKLQIPTRGLKKTKTGISTDSSVLEKLADSHPLPALILDYRGLFKLKSTYVDALPQQISSVTGRLHTRFNQTVTGTGRLSSSEPNLQNIPVQSAEGRRVREAFVAQPGDVLISADYSQIELRILAHMSADTNLIAAFNEDRDIHSITAREILGLDPDSAVSPEQRRLGKTINFGVVYGMGGFRLARDLGIPVSLADRYIRQYFERYGSVKSYFSRIEEQAQKDGFVATMFGRKRFLAAIDASGRDKGFVLRAALNAPIQGSAADLIKLAMIKLEDDIRAAGLPCRMLLQIHDELVFECREDSVPGAMELIRAGMENVVKLAVPLKVDVRAGRNWQEAH